MNVTREIRKVRWMLRWRAAAKGFLTLIGLVTSALIMALVVDPWLGESSHVRAFLLLVFWICLFAGCLRLAVVPLFRVPGPIEIFNQVEQADPYLQNRLSTAYYLKRNPEEVKRLGFSPALMRRTMRWADNLQPETVFHGLYRQNDLLRTVQLTLVPSFLLFLILLLRPQPAMKIWSGYARSQHGESSFVIPPYLLTSGNKWVPRGSPADVEAWVVGAAHPPRLHVEEKPGAWNGIPVEQAAPNVFVGRIPSVDRTMRYRASVDGIFSSVAEVHPVDPPELESIHWHISPPAYTGLADVDAIAQPGVVELLAGSVVSATFRANLPLYSMTLLEPEGTARELSLTKDGRGGGAVLTPDSTHDLRIAMVGPLGLAATSEAIRLEVVEDEPPQAKIITPETIHRIPDSSRVNIIAEARDDYGLSSLGFHYELNYEGKEVVIPLFARSSSADLPEGFQLRLAAEPAGASPMAAAGAIEWDLAPLDLLPGDEISYWLVALDNDIIAGPKEGRSEVHFLRFPSMYEIYESVEQAEEVQVDSLRDIIERQRQLRENVRDSAEKLREDTFSPGERKEKPSWEEQARLEEAATEQQEISQELERIAREVRETSLALQQKTETSLQTLEKMERVRELFDELLTEEMKEVIREFQRALEQFKQERGPEPFDELEFSLEQFEQQLDSLLQLLENTHLQRQLEAAVEEMKQLLQTQEELVERTQEAAAEEERPAEEREELADRLAGQEEAVRDRAEELARRLEELAERMAKQGREGGKDLQQVAKEMREGNLPQDLEEAIQQLSQQGFDRALPAEQRAQQSLAGAAQRLSELQNLMGGMSFEQDMAALLAMIHRSQYLSERHEAVHTGLEQISRAGTWGNPDRKRGLSQEEGILAIESRRLKEAFIEFAGESPFRDFTVARLFEDAATEMSTAAAGTKDREPIDVRARTRAALGHVNLATKKLLDSFCSACQAQQSLGLEGYFRQLRDLIERQKNLNFDTRRLDGKSRQRPSWEQELRRVAQEQEAIRQELEELRKLREQLQKKEELLGDLDKIGDEMGEIEKQLEDRITDERVQEKQDKVLTRLLDAEKSQRQQDLTRERESEVAATEAMPSPPPQDHEAELRRKLSQPEDRLMEEDILPRYRSRIRSYFRRLSAEVF